MMKKMGAKAAVIALASVLSIGGVVGGTIAWLTTRTEPITNEFTVGDINIALTESEGLNLKMVPGNKIDKDPTVTVKANSEACWLFVEVVESANFRTYMTYGMDTGWTKLDGVTPKTANGVVYYREVPAVTTDTSYPVLAGSEDQVTVLETVTKAQLAEAKTNAPTLKFTAYAVQMDNIGNAAEAWAKL